MLIIIDVNGSDVNLNTSISRIITGFKRMFPRDMDAEVIGETCRLELSCKLGCVCDSVFGQRPPRTHCGHPDCMFDSSCTLKSALFIQPFESFRGKTRSKGPRVSKLYDETETLDESEKDGNRRDASPGFSSALRGVAARGRSRGRPRLNRCPIPLPMRGARGRPRLSRNFSSTFNGRTPFSGNGRPRGRPRTSSAFMIENEPSIVLDKFRFPVPPNEPFEDVMTKFLGLGQVSVPNISRASFQDLYSDFDPHQDRLRQLGLQIEPVTEINFIQEESLKSRIAQMQSSRAPGALDFSSSETVPVAVLYEDDLQVTRVIFPVGLRYVYFEKTIIELPFVEESEFWILQRASGVQVTSVSFKVEERYQRFSVSNEMLRGLFVSSARGHILKAGEVGMETNLRIVVSPTFLNYFFVGPFPYVSSNPPLVAAHLPVRKHFQVGLPTVETF